MNRILAIFLMVAAGALGLVAGGWLGRDAATDAGQDAGGTEREILYWVAPMDPSYRRDGPGKSPMGMDLVPVYADQADAAGEQPSIRIASGVVNNIGVKTAPVKRGALYQRIKTVGFVTPNEHRVSHVHVRSEGWIEHLAVHTEGARVQQGDVLFQFFAPALVSAQDEFVQALTSSSEALIHATGRRLLALGLLPGQIEQLRRSREVRRLIDVKAQQSGYVTALNVRHGMFVTPELMVMSIADLSHVWVDVDVFESQIDSVEAGQKARMSLPFASGREWAGEVEYVYPTLRAESRTGRVRLSFDNPDLALKPNMYATVEIDADPRAQALQVPTQSVIRTPDGARVILALGEGRFRPAAVRTGIETNGKTEILAGLDEGERIVVSAQFLIDSEASMDASLMRMIGDESQGGDGSGRDTHGTDHPLPPPGAGRGWGHSGHEVPDHGRPAS